MPTLIAPSGREWDPGHVIYPLVTDSLMPPAVALLTVRLPPVLVKR